MPDKPKSLPARIALAVIERLRADPDLATHYAEIKGMEHDALFTDASTLVDRTLAVIVDRWRVDQSEGTPVEITTLALVDLHLPQPHYEWWERSDRWHHVLQVLEANGGALTDPDHPDFYLTQALTRFDELDIPGRLERGYIINPARVEFYSLRHRRTFE